MKVAIVYHYFALYREAVVTKLCQQKAPDPIYELVSDFEPYPKSIKLIDPEKRKIPVEEGGLRWVYVRNIWIFRIFLWQVGLIRRVFSKKYSTIIFLGNMYYLSTWIGALVAKFTGKRVFMWTHGMIKPEKGLKGFMRVTYYKLADGIFLYGNKAKELMCARGFDPAKLFVVYNSLDYDKQNEVKRALSDETLSSVRAECFKHADFPVLFFVGRVIAQKRLDLLIEAVEILKSEGSPVNCLIVGDGPEREVLNGLVKDKGLDEFIRFYGPCYDEETLGRLIGSSDLCVCPGGVGLLAMHSLNYGTPVITTDNFDVQMPEYEALIEGMTGSFYRDGCSKGLAACIQEWLAEHKDREKVRRDCEKVIADHYNPDYQVRIINGAVNGRATC